MAQGGDPDREGDVLSPDELDIEAREEVAAIGDDRYVIGADREPDAPDPQRDAESGGGDGGGDADGDTAAGSAADEADPDTGSGSDPETTGRDVKRWLRDELADHDAAYAYRIAAKSGDTVAHQELATDDIGAAFDGLLVWYAQQVAAGTPVDEALGILLSESSVQVRYPTERLVAYLEANDIGPNDSVSDLVAAVSEDGGLAFPDR
ncbi:DUF7500 family protein [Halobacterium yunchengense]|uniref:DUF7500 family protein n=1 Tax=Halobacterium yunchengense TaxID=3108497 RepID=UPI0030083E4F